jgi:hypothetical protein
VVVVVEGSVVGGAVVVVGASVVVVVGELVGAVVVVAAGCVVVVPGARVVGVVRGAGNRTESGSVETFDDLALDGAVGRSDFPGELVVEVVVVGPAAGAAVVVVLVAAVVGGSLAEISPTVWPCTSSGRSSWCTTINKAATARTTVVPPLHCSNRR